MTSLPEGAGGRRPGDAPERPPRPILIISEEGTAKIKAAVRAAFEQPLEMETLLDIQRRLALGENVLMGNKVQEVKLPIGISCIFSVENNPPGCWSRHLSIALSPNHYNADQAPDETAVELLLKLFEFEQPFLRKLRIHVHKSKYGDKPVSSLNLYENIRIAPHYAHFKLKPLRPGLN